MLTTGIDVPSICNLVFMRKINSRILFEQMLGRATRLCPEIGKTHFNIFDAVRVYEDLDSTSGMKSVSVSKTMTELLEDLLRDSEENKQPIKDRILARLQRKNNNLTSEQKYDISERLDGVDTATRKSRKIIWMLLRNMSTKIKTRLKRLESPAPNPVI